MNFDPNKAKGDFFAGRKNIPQISVTKDTALRGKTKTTWAQRLNRWASIIFRPIRTYNLHQQDKRILKQEISNGAFSNDTDLQKRKASVTVEHMQSVIKTSQKNNSQKRLDGKKIEKDRPDWIAPDKELERVRTVRIGQGKSDPDPLEPWSEEYMEERQAYADAFMAERKETKQRNQETSEVFSDLHKPDTEIMQLRDSIQQNRRLFYQFKTRLDKLPFYSFEESSSRGKDKPMKRSQLEDKLKHLGDAIVRDYKKIETTLESRVNSEDVDKIPDHKRETLAVMTNIKNGMEQWWDKHRDDFAQIELLLGSDEIDTEDSDIHKEVSIRKAIGWTRKFRKDDLGKLRDEFIELSKDDKSRQDNATRLKSLSEQIYSGEMMTMRLSQIIRESESAKGIGEGINKYLEDNELKPINIVGSSASLGEYNPEDFKSLTDPIPGLKAYSPSGPLPDINTLIPPPG